MNEWEAHYSQPKLEIYGLYHALLHFQLYIIGVKSLIVEVDTKYIKECSTIPTFRPILLSINGLEASLPSHSSLFMYQKMISKELMAFQGDRDLRMTAK